MPRNIFPRGNAENVTQTYIRRATPNRQRSQASSRTRPSERLLWRERLALIRKQNFRQGILALKVRAVKARNRRQWARKRARVEHATLLKKPESEEENLTSPTEMQAVKSLLQKNLSLLHTNDQMRISQRKISSERFIEQKACESRNRVDSIRALYVNATHFITDMSQLQSAVDEAFGSLENPATFGTAEGPNIWFEGKPISIQEQLDLKNNISTSSVSPGERRSRMAERRLNKIANMLLGKSDELEAEE